MFISNRYYHKTNLSVYKLEGKDGLDLLDRISTNSVKSIQENQTITSILTNEKAKFIDVFHLVSESNHIYFICSGNDTLKWIDRFVFTEDVQFIEIDLNCFELLDETNLTRCQSQTVEKSIYFKDEVNRTFCLSETTEFNNQIDQETYDNWRIENLIPDYKFEFTEDFIPTELALIDYISFRKGCYIGQEVIARLDSYKKIHKRLVQITSSEQLSGNMYFVLNNESEKKGKLTTIGNSKNGECHHLAVIHSSIAILDSSVTLESENQKISGIISKVHDKRLYSEQA